MHAGVARVDGTKRRTEIESRRGENMNMREGATQARKRRTGRRRKRRSRLKRGLPPPPPTPSHFHYQDRGRVSRETLRVNACLYKYGRCALTLARQDARGPSQEVRGRQGG